MASGWKRDHGDENVASSSQLLLISPVALHRACLPHRFSVELHPIPHCRAPLLLMEKHHATNADITNSIEICKFDFESFHFTCDNTILSANRITSVFPVTFGGCPGGNYSPSDATFELTETYNADRVSYQIKNDRVAYKYEKWGPWILPTG